MEWTTVSGSGVQGQVFIEKYSQVSGSDGRWNFILTNGDCWIGRMFAKFEMYKQELSLTVIEFKVVLWHPQLNVTDAGLSLVTAASVLDDPEFS